MRFLKWSVLFLAAFMVAWVLIFTFSQPPFRIAVPARILAYQTPSIPIYVYVAGGFGIGLLIGLWVALYYYFILQRQIRRKSKDLATVEKELAHKDSEMERYQQELDRKNELIEQLTRQEKQSGATGE